MTAFAQTATLSASEGNSTYSASHTEDFEYHYAFDHLFGYYSKLYNDLSWL